MLEKNHARWNDDSLLETARLNLIFYSKNKCSEANIQVNFCHEACKFNYSFPDSDGLFLCVIITDDDLEDETFEEEETTSPQNHSPIWKSPALEPRTHSPKTSTSPATSPSYHSRHREKSPPSHHRPSPDHHRHTDNHTHKERSTPDHHTRTERSIPDHHTDTHRSLLDRHTEKKPDHDRHNDRSTHEHSRRAEKTESSPSYYQRHRDTAPAANSQKSDKVPPPVPGNILLACLS